MIAFVRGQLIHQDRDSALIDYATMLEGRGLIAAKGEGR